MICSRCGKEFDKNEEKTEIADILKVDLCDSCSKVIGYTILCLMLHLFNISSEYGDINDETCKRYFEDLKVKMDETYKEVVQELCSYNLKPEEEG